MNTSIRMRIGARGQVVIPKEMRDRFGLLPHTEVEFVEEKGRLLMRPVPQNRSTTHDAWDEVWGIFGDKIEDVDREIEEMRGR